LLARLQPRRAWVGLLFIDLDSAVGDGGSDQDGPNDD
jgi:hypothetical protein